MVGHPLLGEIKPEVSTVICTNAFGMGLDIPDVRMVIHWQQPASVENYLQEFGRAGSDGKAALAVLFVSVADIGVLQFMAQKTVEQANLDPKSAELAVRAKFEAIEAMRVLATSRKCFRRDLIQYFEGDPRRTRRTLGRWIVAWLSSASTWKHRASLCCDACARMPQGEYQQFTSRVLSQTT